MLVVEITATTPRHICHVSFYTIAFTNFKTYISKNVWSKQMNFYRICEKIIKTVQALNSKTLKADYVLHECERFIFDI